MVGTHTEKGVCTTLASCHGLRLEPESRTASVKSQQRHLKNEFSDRHGVNGQWPVIQRMCGRGGEPDWLLRKEGTWWLGCNGTLPLGAHALSPIQCQPSCILGNREWFCVCLIIMLLTENLSAAN